MRFPFAASSLLLLMAACHGGSPLSQVQQSLVSYETLHEFTSPLGDPAAEGVAPMGELVEVDGRLYGTLWQRGPNQDPVTKCNLTSVWGQDEQRLRCPGSVYSLALDGSDFRVEHGFSQLDPATKNVDGYQPRAGLTLLDGRLYGMTWLGGPRGYGEAFSFEPGAFGSLLPERTFGAVPGATDGAYPISRFTAVDGHLYGLASKWGLEQDGGTLFRLDVQTPLHRFVKATEGGIPRGGVAYSGGKLHGATLTGAVNGRGAYFTYDLTTGRYETVAPFPAFVTHPNGSDNTPYNPLITVSDGRVYGLRTFGGVSGTGMVFRGDGTTLEVIFEFDNVTAATPPTPRFANGTGAFPMGALVEGTDGLLYGVTRYGGENGTGNIFRLARDGTLFQSLYSFPADGTGLHRRPYGGLVVGSDGAMYGTTHTGTSSVALAAGGGVYRFLPPTAVLDVCD